MNPVLVILWSVVAAYMGLMFYLYGWGEDLAYLTIGPVIIALPIHIKFSIHKVSERLTDPETGNLAANDSGAPS